MQKVSDMVKRHYDHDDSPHEVDTVNPFHVLNIIEFRLQNQNYRLLPYPPVQNLQTPGIFVTRSWSVYSGVGRNCFIEGKNYPLIPKFVNKREGEFLT